jgi:hypothetical protein
MIQIESVRAPFNSLEVAFQITALGCADATRLLPADEHMETLVMTSFRKIVRHIHRAGIVGTIQLELGQVLTDSSPGLERALERLNAALEESTALEFEWESLNLITRPRTAFSAARHFRERDSKIQGGCSIHTRRCRWSFALFEPDRRRTQWSLQGNRHPSMVRSKAGSTEPALPA